MGCFCSLKNDITTWYLTDHYLLVVSYMPGKLILKNKEKGEKINEW